MQLLYSCLKNGLLDLNLYFYAAGEFEFHQSVNSLCCAAVDVDQTLEVGELELLACLLVDERTAVYGVDALVGGQGNRTAHDGTCGLNGLHDFLC